MDENTGLSNKAQANVITYEESTDYDSFKMAEHPWLPEVRSGDSLQALADDIARNGLQEPILVDENSVIHHGRSRLAACRLANVPVKIVRCSSNDGEKFAKAGLLHRDRTVYDDVLLVRHVWNSVDGTPGEGETRDRVSTVLKTEYGRGRGYRPKNVQTLYKIGNKMAEEMDEEIVKKIRNAENVHQANLVVFPTEKSKPSGNITITAIRHKLEEMEIYRTVDPKTAVRLVKWLVSKLTKG